MQKHRYVISNGLVVAALGLGILAVGQSREAGDAVTGGPLGQDSETIVAMAEDFRLIEAVGKDSETFDFVLEADPAALSRAFLIYEADLPPASGLVRTINQYPPQGGVQPAADAATEPWIEEINPLWLRPGRNEIRFGAAPAAPDPAAGITDLRRRLAVTPADKSLLSGVSRVWLAVVEDDGRPLVRDAWSSAPAPSALGGALVDGDSATGWAGEDDPRSPFRHSVELPFRRSAQPHTLELSVDGRLQGTLLVEALTADGAAVWAGPPVELTALEPGQHRLALDPDLPPSRALRLAWSEPPEGGGRLSEVDVLTHPAAAGELAPRLTLTRPQPGEGAGDGVCLRGFVEPAANASGAAEIFVDDVYVAAAVSPEDGAFELFVPRPREAGDAWSVELEVLYPDGRRLHKTIPVGGEPGPAAADAPSRKTLKQLAQPGRRNVLRHEGARLEIPGEALMRKVAITVKPLVAAEVAALDAGMTNVTARHPSYRFGPDGLKFARPVTLTLPFDRSLIPAGLNAEDVRTYFFNQETGRWVPLERVAVDEGEGMIVSSTDHFTDFINATLTVPDYPSGENFNRNSISELAKADASAGITLIEPPEASATGDAELSFPLRLPPGRRGLAPELKVTYSSHGSNGWLGLGWNLSPSAIEVDTSFGVPRYRPQTESETYLLDGEFLAPTANPGAARQSDRVFTQRVEGSFQRIIRKGSAPDGYWWEVTDKFGTRFIYGRSEQARLRDYQAPHNTFRWQLEQVVDVHGNTVDYTYFTDGGSNGEPWVRSYLSRIDYTGVNGSGGHYHVLFVLDGGDRPDRLSSGLSGFKVYTRYRLDHVDVVAGTALVRRYQFHYREGEFGKTLLEAIAVVGGDAQSEHYRHDFDYFPMPTQGDGFDGFASESVWGQMRAGDDCSEKRSISGGLSAFVGVGPPGACMPHGGIQVGANFGDSTALVDFLDVNGDGLADRLSESGQVDLNAYDPATNQGGFTTGSFPGTGTLNHSWEMDFSLGLGFHALGELAQVGGSWVWSHSFDDHAMADLNGDGFPDLVSTAGGFCVRLNEGGQGFGPCASAKSAWQGFSLKGIDLSIAKQSQDVLEEFKLSDALRKLVVPYDGEVRIDGSVQKKTPTGEDGVEVAIYHNNVRVWQRSVAAEDTSACAPGAGDSCSGDLTLNVSSGDRLYFLAGAVSETGGDELLWAPRVSYVGRDLSAREPFGAGIFEFDAAADFRLAGPPGGGWMAPASGEVLIAGALDKRATADDVTVRVRHNGEVIYAVDLAAAEEGVFDAVPPLAVTRGDALTFHIESDVQVDPDRVRWTPTVSYEGGLYCRAPLREGDPEVCGAVSCTPNPGSGGVECEMAGDPTPEVPLLAGEITQSAQVMVDVHRLLPVDEPTVFWSAPEAGPATIEVEWTESSAGRSAPVVVYVQGLNRLYEKREVEPAQSSVSFSLTVDLVAGEPLYVTAVAAVAAETGELAAVRVAEEEGEEDEELPTNRRYRRTGSAECDRLRGECDVISGGYHGWFYGEWNGNAAFDESAFTENDEENPPDFVAAMPRWQGVKNLSAPAWQGVGHDFYIGAEGCKPSRRGMNAVVELRRAAGGDGTGMLRKSYGHAGGISLGLVASLGLSLGYTAGQLDLVDVNGDRYPDQVSEGAVRYCTGQGFGELETLPGFGGDFRRIQDGNVSLGIGVGMTFTKKNSKGKSKAVVSTMPSVGTATSLAQERVNLVDVNGDGLPDRVSLDPGDGAMSVQLNLGYRFGAAEAWPLPAWTWSGEDRCREVLDFFSPEILDFIGDLNDPNALSYTVNAAENAGLAIGPIGGGVGTTLSRTLVQVVDVNGDGLADHVSKDHGEDFFRVKFNLGDRWGAEQRWYAPGWQSSLGDRYNPIQLLQCFDAMSYSGMISGNGSIGFANCFTLVPPVPVIGLQLEISGQMAGGRGGVQLVFEDLDGDGLPDHVLKKSGDSNVYVKRNLAGKVHLLRQVVRPLGGRFTLDYRRQGNRVDHSDPEHLVDMPENRWVLASVVLEDGRGHSYPTHFEYFNDAYYDRSERIDYGYARIRETRPDGSTVETSFHNQDLYRRHLPSKVVTADAAGRLYTVTTTAYDLRPVAAQSFFPAAVQEASFFYEGTTADENGFQKSTWKSFGYDAVGNVIQVVDQADEGPEDDTIATVAYYVDAGRHVFKPAVLEARDRQGRLLRKRLGSYDAWGELVRLEEVLIGGRDPATGSPYDGSRSPVWSLVWDEVGNLASITDPVGFQYALSYDAVTRTHVVQVVDSFGYATHTAYDLRFGLPTEIRDKNGNPITRSYDQFGRLSQVFAPGDEPSAPTVRMEYAAGARPAWALTANKDVTRSDAIETVVFVDGLGREIQTKRDTEIDQGNGTRIGMEVSGKVEFDLLGRVAARGQPFFHTGPTTDYVDAALTNPTRYVWDVLDRAREVRFPDGAETRLAYGFGDLDGVRRLTRIRTDAEDKVTATYLDVDGEVLAVGQSNTIGGVRRQLTTRYGYNPLAELTSVRDALGNVTSVEYDTLGRRTVIDSPDLGRSEMRYDLGGNLGATITAELAAQSRQIRHHYTFNRLDRIDYPETADVVYTWGGPGAPFNRADRIVTVSDESGEESRFYGVLGETVRTVKTATALNGNSPQGPYATTFEWDALGRLLGMTYPDGEQIRYGFDAGGRVSSASGQLRGERYDYVAHLTYDVFGNRKRIAYGNGSETRFEHDPLTLRLARLHTTAQRGREIQDLRYDYNLVGSILRLENDVPAPRPNEMGGPSVQSFAYDDLYQLIAAEGSYRMPNNQRSLYDLSLGYDEIGNLRTKHQLHQLMGANGKGTVQKKTSYDWSYQYGGPQPHAPTQVGGRSFHYDRNGNQSGWDDDGSGQRRTITWNEENRVRAVSDNGRTTRFLYNARGERTNKEGQHGETIYVNSYFSIRNGAIASKHVFADEVRVATRIAQPGGKAQGRKEEKRYFYHRNHQDSTHLVTDDDGEVCEHLEYFPFGELWVDERTETQRTPYLYTAKELDEETGLAYFGARYQDPRQSQWISADPILDRLLKVALVTDPDSSLGPFRLPGHLYAYAANDPVNMVDPTGLAPKKKSARLVAMGRTPSKSSGVGKKVVDRMRKAGDVKGTGKSTQVRVPVTQGGKKVWKPLDKNIHMGHIKDAVTYWNKTGYKHGPKASQVRTFMLDDKNYELEWGPLNSSNGAKLQQQYRKPATWPAGKAWP